jgi:ABC-type uncharacterized transport system permease subunit
VLNEIVTAILFYVTAATYVAASVLFLRYLVRGTGEKGERLAPRLVAVGAGMHAGHIVVSSLVLRVCPVEGIHFPMSVASMLMCVAYLYGRIKYRVEVAGAFVAPLALTSLLASRFVGQSEPGKGVRSVLLPFHVTMNLVGVALFALAFSAAALYLVQERLLKQKRIDGVSRRLPPLDALDRAEHRFLLAGFPLLTIGIVTGTVWAGRVETGAPGEVLRAVFGYVTWLVIAGVLFLRAAAGWRGRRAAYGTITGFALSVVVLVIYLVRGSPAPAPATHADASDVTRGFAGGARR